MESKKRCRSKNFTDREKEELLNIVESYCSILENKKTDNISVKKKKNTWEDIKNQYNAIQTSGERNINQLQHLYDESKRRAKKNFADDKVEQYTA